jgi:hypothetical protein
MKMSAKHAVIYQDYLMPLRLLEKALRASGMVIRFELTLSENGDKWIEITEGSRPPHVISIEGDNPAMAVKDVAAAVRL